MEKFNKIILDQKSRYCLLLIITPVFWLSILNVSDILSEWAKTNVYLKSNLSQVFSQEKNTKIQELRWVDAQAYNNDLFGRVVYNKELNLVDQLGDFVTFLSPRLYFQSGDGGTLSPKNVEPTSLFFYPFWIIGIIALLKTRRFKLLAFLIFFAVASFLIGKKSFQFLLPVVLLYIYFVDIGIGQIKNLGHRKAAVILILLYNFYILARFAWL